MELPDPVEEHVPAPRAPRVRAGLTSDLLGVTHPPVHTFGHGSLIYLGVVANIGAASVLRASLGVRALDVDEARGPEGLRLELVRALQEPGVGARSIAGVVLRDDVAFAAATAGASVTLVRNGEILGSTLTCARFDVLQGDRVVLLCDRLHPLLVDAELGRLACGDDPEACALTLVEVGHLRGGSGLWSVVAELGSSARTPVQARPDLGFDALLQQLGPTLAGVARELPPVPPRARRSLLRQPVNTEERTQPFAPEREVAPVREVAHAPAVSVPPAAEPVVVDEGGAHVHTNPTMDRTLRAFSAPGGSPPATPRTWPVRTLGGLALLLTLAALAALAALYLR